MGATSGAVGGSGPTTRPTVIGLDAGREVARRAQRRRRRKNGIVSAMMAIVFTGALGIAAWLGYQAYTEHQADDQREHDRRVAEIERRESTEGVDEMIDQLEEDPSWNGPGNPAFGVGGDSATP